MIGLNKETKMCITQGGSSMVSKNLYEVRHALGFKYDSYNENPLTYSRPLLNGVAWVGARVLL